MCDELTSLNPKFFEEYIIKIETREIVVKLSMRQGDCILPRPPNENGQFQAGTLGGFVTKTNDPQQKYALTCGHIFPEENLPAFADNSLEFKQIGSSVFTKQEVHCDFAAIRINDSASRDCDVTFRREDEQETNARVYEESITNLGFVYKFGAGSNLTRGKILSPEHYFSKTLIADANRNSVFLVKGFGGPFCQDGDSGSLVFSRPKTVSQTFINIVGMVFGFDANLIEESNETAQNDVIYSRVVDNESRQEEKSSSFLAEKKEHITMCFRLRPALDRFEEETRESYKFKDDLPMP